MFAVWFYLFTKISTLQKVTQRYKFDRSTLVFYCFFFKNNVAFFALFLNKAFIDHLIELN